MPQSFLTKSDDISIDMQSIKGSGGSIEERSNDGPQPPEYRLYKRRWIGLIALVVLGIVTGMVLVWFGPIANAVVDEFGFTLDEINWFGNVTNVVYIPAALIIPYLYGRLGLRGTGYIGGALFVISAWIRYAGTSRSLSKTGSLALIMIGQLLAGLTIPIFQIIVPSYSERWFDLKSRTTATMIMSLANPVGNALGQLVPPLLSDTRESLLVMAIIFTIAAPFVFLIGERPPTPPTFAATHEHPSFTSLLKAMLGTLPRDEYTFMTVQQRIDFAIVVLVFGMIVGVINAFTVLTAQQFGPYGYSEDLSGLMGATLLLVGLVAAALTAPLYDRVFTHHLALSCKLLTPIMAACWIALIWEVKPNNNVVLFVLMGIIGGTSLSLLPVVIELAVELTRNADGSSALLWLSTNVFGLVFVLVEGHLREGPDANPPLNMHRAIIFQASLVSASVLMIYFAEGKQTRRAQDELQRSQAAGVAHQGASIELIEVPGGRSDSSDSAVPRDSDIKQRESESTTMTGPDARLLN